MKEKKAAEEAKAAAEAGAMPTGSAGGKSLSSAELTEIREKAVKSVGNDYTIPQVPPENITRYWSKEDSTTFFTKGGLFYPASYAPVDGALPPSYETHPAVAAAPPKPQGPPILVSWFGAGNTQQMTRDFLKPVLDAARSKGVGEQLTLYLPHEFPAIKTWGGYVDKMVELIDEDPKRKGRPLILLGFSAGALAAYGVAERLGGRVLQLVVCGLRRRR